jgi:hypothetical protein
VLKLAINIELWKEFILRINLDLWNYICDE